MRKEKVMISIKIILLCIIIQNMVMQFWLRSEFNIIKNYTYRLSRANYDNVQSLREACFLQSRLENERN